MSIELPYIICFLIALVLVSKKYLETGEQALFFWVVITGLYISIIMQWLPGSHPIGFAVAAIIDFYFLARLHAFRSKSRTTLFIMWASLLGLVAGAVGYGLFRSGVPLTIYFVLGFIQVAIIIIGAIMPDGYTYVRGSSTRHGLRDLLLRFNHSRIESSDTLLH